MFTIDEQLHKAGTVLNGYGRQEYGHRKGDPIFEGAIPEDVVADFFPIMRERPCGHQNIDGSWVADKRHKYLQNLTTGAVCKPVGASAATHQYHSTFLGMGLPIQAAGQTRGGFRGWIQLGTGEQHTGPGGIGFGTMLLIFTSMDGSLSTGFGSTSRIGWCNNMFTSLRAEAAASAESTKIRHSRWSEARVEDVRARFSALGDVAADTSAAIAADLAIQVDAVTRNLFLDQMFPATAPGTKIEGKSIALQGKQRDDINARLAWLWNGEFSQTAFGLLQAVDTAARWDRNVRGTERNERVMEGVLSGAFDKALISNRERLLALV